MIGSSAAARLRHLDQPVELLTEPQRERRRRLAALEAEEGVRHRPPFVHLADDVGGGSARHR